MGYARSPKSTGGTTLQLVQVQQTLQDPVQPLLTLNMSESGDGTVEAEGFAVSRVAATCEHPKQMGAAHREGPEGANGRRSPN